MEAGVGVGEGKDNNQPTMRNVGSVNCWPCNLGYQGHRKLIVVHVSVIVPLMKTHQSAAGH
eukprot:scaffold39984_cov51-Cyclotella_meneghiniana.AAC.1